MAPGFFSSVSKSFREWRRRAQEAAKKIAPKEFVLEFLEERLNPANFNIDLANYNGILQVNSVGSGFGGLIVSQAGQDQLTFSSYGDSPSNPSYITINGVPSTNNSFTFNLSGQSTLQGINISTQLGVHEDVQFNNLSAGNFSGTTALKLSIAPSQPGYDNDSMLLANVSTVASGNTTGGEISLTGGNGLVSGFVITGSGGLTIDSQAIFLDSTPQIQTFGGAISLTGPVTLLDSTTLATYSATYPSAGSAPITINGSVSQSGTRNLTLFSGDKATTVSGAIEVQNLTLQDNSTSSAGLVDLRGDLKVYDLTTYSQNYAVNLTGATIVSSTALNFLNTGVLTLGNQATDSITANGAITATAASSVNMSGNISASGAINLAATTLGANSTLDASSGIGYSVNLLAGVDLNGHNLITKTGASSSTILGGILTLNGELSATANFVLANAAITLGGTTSITTPGILTFSGTTTIDGQGADLELQAADLILAGGPISNVATLTVAATANRSIGLGTGSGGQFQLDQAELNLLGAAQLVFGNGTSTIRVGDPSTGSDTVVLAHSTKFAGKGSTTIIGSNINVTGDYVVADAVEVSGGSYTVTATGNIDITGGKTGIYASAAQTTNSLTIQATGTVSVGSSTGFSKGGTANYLDNLTLSGSSVTVGATSQISGNFNLTTSSSTANLAAFTAGNSITFNNAGTLTTSGTLAASLGSISQTGIGLVSLGGNLTAGTKVQLATDTTLAANSTILAPTINLVGALDGSFDLTLKGSSSNTLSGLVGANTPLSSLVFLGSPGTIAISKDITTTGNITVTGGTGLASFQNLTTQAGGAISLATASAINLISATTASGPITLDGSTGATVKGSLNGGAISVTSTSGITSLVGITSTGAVQVSGTGGINLAGNIVAGGNVTLGSLGQIVTATNSLKVSSSGASAFISSPGSLVLNSGVTITLADGGSEIISVATVTGSASGAASNLTVNTSGSLTATGAISQLGGFNLTTGTATTLQAVTTTTATLDGGSGSQAFQGLFTAGSVTTSSNPFNLSFTGNLSASGVTSLSNAGTTTLGDNSSDSLSFQGGLIRAGGPTTLAGSISAITTAGISVETFSVSANSQITTSSGKIVVGNGGNATTIASGATLTITSSTGAFQTVGPLNGPGSLAVSVGGAVSFADSVGATTPLGSLNIQQAVNATFSAAVSAGTLTLGSSLTGTVTLADTVTLTNGLTAGAGAYSLLLEGDSSIAGASTFNNTGTLTLGKGGSTTSTFNSGLTATAPSSVIIAGNLTTTTFASGLILGDANTALSFTDTANLTTNNGTVTLSASTLGTGVTLGVNSGLGAISLDQIANGKSATGTLLQLAGGALTATGSLDVDALSLSNSSATFSSVVGATIAPVFTVLAPSTGIIAFSGPSTNLASGSQFNSGNYGLQFDSALTTFQGDVNFNNTGALRLGDNSTDNLAFQGALAAKTNSSIALSGTHKYFLAASSVELGGSTSGAISLGADSSLLPQTGATGMSITLGNTTQLQGKKLIVGSGLDTILSFGAVSGSLGDLIINTTAQVATTANWTTLSDLTITNAGSFTSTSAISAKNLTINDLQGTNTFQVQGALNLSGNLLAKASANAYSVSLLGDAAVTGNATFANTGTLTLGNTATDSYQFASGLTATAPSMVSLAGSISTTNANLQLGLVTLLDNTSISSGSGTITSGAISGSQELTLGALGQTGTINVTGPVNTVVLKAASSAYAISLLNGATFSQAVTLTNTGTVTLGDATTDTFNFDGGLNRTAGDTSLFGTVASNNQKITLGSVNLVGTSSLDAGTEVLTVGDVVGASNATLALGSGNSGSISLVSFARNVSTGANANLTFNTTGTLAVTGAIGQGVGTLKVVQADTANFFGSIGYNGTTATPVGSLLLTSASTAMNFFADMAVTSLTTGNGAFDLSFTGSKLSVNNSVTLQNLGIVVLGDSASDAFTFADGLNTTAPASIQLGGSLSTTNSSIKLAAATLIANTTLSTGSGAITLLQVTGNGSQDLSINTTGALTVSGATSKLNTLTLANTGGATFSGAVDASSLNIQNTTGTISLPAGAVLGSLTTAAKNYSLDFNSLAVSNATSLINTGTVTLSGSIAIDGGLTATSPLSINLISATISALGTGVLNLATANPLSVTGLSQIGGTSTGAISLPSIVLANSASLILGAGASTAITTGAISGTVGGATSSVAFDTLGAVTVNGAIGTDLSTVTITNASGATFASTLTAGSVTIASASGTVTVAGNINTTGNFDALSAPYSLQLQGASNNLGGKLTLANQGTAFLGTANSSKTLASGGISGDPGNSITAIGNLFTAGNPVTLDTLSLAGNLLIDTTNNGTVPAGAPISASTTNTNGYLLTLNAGTGGKTIFTDITLSGVFTSTSPVEFAGKLTLAASSSINAPGVSFTSSGSVAGNKYSLALATNSFAFAAGALLADLNLISIQSQTSGTAIGLGDKSGATLLLSDAFLAATDSASGVLSLQIGSGAGTGVLRVATADGQVEINTDTQIHGSGSTTVLSSDVVVAGNFILDDAVQVDGGNRLVEASGNLTITGGTTGLFSTKGQTNSLALKAGSTLLVGSSTAFSAGSGNLLQNATLEGGIVTLGSANAILAGNLVATSIAGTLTFSGQVVTGGSVSLQSDSPISLQAITTGAVAGLGFSQTGAGAVTLRDSLTTSGGSISFDSNITLSTAIAGALVSIATTGSTSTGAVVSLQGITGSSNDLRLDSGKGAVSVAGSVAGIDELQLQSSAVISTGTISFQSTVSANTLTTYAQPYAISFLGDTTVQQATNLTNTGLATLGDGNDDDLTFVAGLVHTSGATTVGGNISTSNAALSLDTATVLESVLINTGTAASTFNTLILADGINLLVTSGAADFTTIDSAKGGSGSISIKATGQVLVSGAIGKTTPLSAFNLQTANGTKLQSTLNAETFSIDKGVTGTVVATGAVTLDTLSPAAGAYSLSLLAGGSVNNDLVFLNTGNLTLNIGAGNTLALGGALTANTQSLRTISGTISTVGTMTFGTATLGAATALIGTGGLGLGAVTSGGYSLRIESGSGAPLAMGSMSNLAGGLIVTNSGATTSLGDLGTTAPGSVTITDSQGLVTFAGTVNATNLTITDSQAGVTFAKSVSASGKVILADTADAKTITFTGALSAASLAASAPGKTDTFNISLQGNTSVSGATTAYNTGSLNLGATTTTAIDLQGGLTHSVGPTTLGGILTTSGAAISLADLALTTTSTIRTQTSGLPGANLTLSGSLDGANYNLTIDLGNVGSWSNTGQVDKIGSLTITNAANATFLGAFGSTAPGISLTLSALATGGTVSFASDATLASLANNAPTSNWTFTGGNTIVTQQLALTTTGSVSLGGGASLVTFSGGATVLAGAGITVNGQVQTSGGKSINLGDVTHNITVLGTSILGGTTTGPITLGNLTLDDKASLTLQGSSSASLLGIDSASGATSTSLTVNLAGALTVSGNVDGLSALTLSQAAGAAFLGNIGSAAPGSLSVGNSITGTLQFTGASATFTQAALDAGPYLAEFKNTNATTIQSNTQFNNTGGVWLGTPSSQVTIKGTLEVTSSTVTLAGAVGTTGKNIQFLQDTVVNGTTKLETNLGSTNGANITLQGALNGATPGADSITLTSGTGTITATGLVGATNRLGSIILGPNAGVTMSSAVVADKLHSIAPSTGTLRFDAPVSAPLGVNLSAKTIESSSITTSRKGAAAGDISLTANSITLRGDILAKAISTGLPGFNAKGGEITLQGAVVLDAPTVRLDNEPVSGAIFSFVNNSIQIAGTIDGLNADSSGLIVAGFGTSITVSGAIGSSKPLADLTFNGLQTGNISLQAITATSLSTQGNDLLLNGPIALSGDLFAKGSTISMANNATVKADNMVLEGNNQTTLGTGAIGLSGNFIQRGAGLVNSGANITAGSIQFASPVTLSADVTLNTQALGGDIKLNTVDNPAGTPKTLTLTSGFGNVSAGNIGGARDLASVAINSQGEVTLANVQAAGVIGASGSLLRLGGSTIASSAAGILFIGPIELSGTGAVSLSAGGGDLRLFGTVDDPGSNSKLTATATGSLQVDGEIGGTSKLASASLQGSTVTLGANTTTLGSTSILTNNSKGQITLAGSDYVAGGSLAIGSSIDESILLTALGSAPVSLVASANLLVPATISTNLARDLNLTSSNLFLGSINASGGKQIRQVLVSTNGGTSTFVGSSISLDGNSGQAGSFTLLGDGPIALANSLTIDTNTAFGSAGQIALGKSSIHALAAGYDLVLDSSAPGSSAGELNFGTVSNDAGKAYLLRSFQALAQGFPAGAIILNTGTIHVAGGLSDGVKLNGRVQTTDHLQITSPGSAVALAPTSGSFSSDGTPWRLAIDTSSSSGSGGSVELGLFDAFGGGNIGAVEISTSGTKEGTLTLGRDLFLEGGFTLLNSGQVAIAGQITLDTNQSLPNGGAVYFGSSGLNAGSSISATVPSASLAINTSASGVGGNVALGSVNGSSGSYLASLSIDAGIGSNSSGNVRLNGNITVAGPVTIDGLVQIPASTSIATNAGSKSGSLSLAASSGGVSGLAAGLALDLQTKSATSSGGKIVLGKFDNAAGAFLESILATTSGASQAGVLTLRGNLSLDGFTAPASLIYNAENQPGASVVADGIILIDTAYAYPTGGLVYLGKADNTASATISALTLRSSLSILTDSTSTAGGIAFGEVTNTAGFYLDELYLNAGIKAQTHGQIRINAANIFVNSDTNSAISLFGTVVPTRDLALQTWKNGASSGSILIQGTINPLNSGIDLVLDASIGVPNQTGGSISLDVISNSLLALQSITLSTKGTAGAGLVQLAGTINLRAQDADPTFILNNSGQDTTVSLTRSFALEMGGDISPNTRETNPQFLLGSIAPALADSTVTAAVSGATLTYTTTKTSTVAFGSVDDSGGSFLSAVAIHAAASSQSLLESFIYLNGSTLSTRGDVSLQADKIVMASDLVISSANGGTNAGDVTLSGLVTTSSDNISLTVDTSTTATGDTGGLVSLAGSEGLKNVTLTTSGPLPGTDGTVTLGGNVTLINGNFVLTNPASVLIAAPVVIRTSSSNGKSAGSVLLGDASDPLLAKSTVRPIGIGNSLSIVTGAQSGTAGDIALGDLVAGASNELLTSLELSAEGSTPDNDGSIVLNGDLRVGGTVDIQGRVRLASSTTIDSSGAKGGWVRLACNGGEITPTDGTSGVDLSINTAGTLTSGSIFLGSVSENAGSFLNDILLQTGTALGAGSLHLLGSVALAESSGDSASFTFASNGGKLFVDSLTTSGQAYIEISTAAGGSEIAGDILLGGSTLESATGTVVSTNGGDQLSLVTAAGTTSGNIAFGQVIGEADNFLGSIQANALISNDQTGERSQNPGTVRINGNSIATSGTADLIEVFLAGNVLLTQSTTIATNSKTGSVSEAGFVQFAGKLSGSTPGIDLDINTSATSVGGSIGLSTIEGLRQISTNSEGATLAGEVALYGDITLDPALGGQTKLNIGSTAGIIVDLVGSTILAINTHGGEVVLGNETANLSARSAGQSVSINTNATGGNAGNVTLRTVNANAGALLSGLLVDAGTNSANPGQVLLTGDISVEGPTAIDGNIGLSSSRQITTSGSSSLVRLAVGAGSVSSQTPGQSLGVNTSGGTVALGLFDNTQGYLVNQLLIDTRGISSSGTLLLNDDLTLESLSGSAGKLILQSNNSPVVIVGNSVTVSFQGNLGSELPSQIYLGKSDTSAASPILAQGAGNSFAIKGNIPGSIAFGTVGNGAGGTSDNFLDSFSVYANKGSIFANTGSIFTDGGTTAGVSLEGSISFKPADGGSTLTIDTDQSGINNAGDITLQGFIATVYGQTGSLVLDTRSSGSFDSGLVNSLNANTNLAGDLTVYTSSQSDSGPVTLGRTTVGGATKVEAGSAVVSIANSSNDFTGPVSISTTGEVVLRDANALILGDMRLGSAQASFTAGNISQKTGSVFTQLVDAQLATLSASTGSILLANSGNVLTAPLALETGTNGSITIANSAPLLIGMVTMPETLGGSLSLTASGGISQTSSGVGANPKIVTGTGIVVLAAGAGPITLPFSANRFNGTVSASNTGVSSIELNTATPLNLDQLSMTPTAAGTLKLSAAGISQLATGAITTGTGTIELTAGNGDLKLANSQANAFNGLLLINAAGSTANLTGKGAMTLGASAVGSKTQSTPLVIVAEGGDITDTDILNLLGTSSFSASKSGAIIALDQLNATGAITVNTTGTGANATLVNGTDLAFQGTVAGLLSATASSGAITDSGTINFGSGMVLRAPGNSLFDTNLTSSANGGITFQGSGALTLTGTSSYTGNTVVNDGRLIVNGSIANSFVVINSGTLLGTGTVGSVSSLGDVRPGNSPGILTSKGIFTLIQPAKLGMEVNGPTPGTGYDQLVATQGVILNSPTLDLKIDPAFNPQSAVQLVLIENQSKGKVQGTFAGLPEGSLVPLNGVNFVLSYRGGTGNDVTLSRFSATPILVGSGSAWNNNGTTSATVAIVLPGQTTSAPTYVQPLGPNQNSGITVANGVDPNSADRLMLVGAGPGGGSTVKLINITQNTTLLSFEAFPGFQGGVYVALADINSDNTLDLIVGAGQGAAPSVAVFNGLTGQVITSFYAFSPQFTGGVRVAAADTNNDGKIDIVTGSGFGARATLNIFDGADSFKLKSAVFTLNDTFTGGVYVSSGDLNGDGRAEVIVGAGQGYTPTVVVYQGGTNLERIVTTFYAYDPAFFGGVRVGTSQATNSSAVNITTGSGVGSPVDIRVFSGTNFEMLDALFDVLPEMNDGVYMG